MENFETIQIDKDAPLFPGDVVRLYFTFFGPNWVYLRASELAVLQWRLGQQHPDWEMLRWNSVDYPNQLVLDFVIKEPQGEEIQIAKASAVTTGALIAVIVIGGGLFTWLSFSKIEKIVSSPAGFLGMAALLVAVLFVWRHYSE